MKFISLICLLPSLALAALDVVTTIPDLAWAAKEIGKEHVRVRSILKGTENAHYIDAKPKYIHMASNADVVCQVGLDLEVGWLPKVLERSGNGDVQPGGKGFCDTGKAIKVLEKPTGPVDRSMGDVHPAGNPHYWISPIALIDGASVIRDTFIAVDGQNAKAYQKNFAALKKQLQDLAKKGKMRIQAAVPKDAKLMEYHKEFSYFLETYGLTSFGTLEEKPGIPPSAGRIAQMAASVKGAGVRMMLAAENSPHRVLRKFRELSGVKVKRVPTSVQPSGKFRIYSDFQNHLIDTVIEGMGQSRAE